MEKQSYWKLFPVTFLLLLLTAACVESDMDGGGKTGSLLSVDIPTGVVPLQATQPIDTRSVSDTTGTVTPVDSLPVSVTRAATVYKRAIVLQYKDGKLVNGGYTDLDNYTIGSPVSASLVEAKGCNIYVLAVNETTTSGADATFSTEAELNAAAYDLYSMIPSPSDDDIPLAGSLKNVNVSRLSVGGTDAGLIEQGSGESRIELSRIAAKLSLKLIYSVPGYQVIASSGKISNVPSRMYFTEQPGDTFPAEDAAGAFTDVSFTVSDCDGDANDQPATEVVRYLPANIRGTNPAVTHPKEKYNGTAPKTSVDRCTFITFTAEEKKNKTHKLVYSFYPGGNTTSDFNIRRNYIYTMNSTIAQAAEGDKRITESGRALELETDPLAQAVGETGATLRAKVTSFDAAPSEYGFYYKEKNTFEGATGATKITATNLASGVYTATVTGLAAKTVYYYRAYAINSGQTVYGSLSSFSTNAEGVPVLTTINAPVSAANGLSATSSGNSVTGADILSRGIVYSAQSGFDHLSGGGIRVDGSPAGGSSPYTVTLQNLTKGTIYWFRHYASNPQGYVYATESQFRTKDSPELPTGGKVESTVVNQLTFSATLPDRKNPVDDYPTAAGVRYWTADPGNTLASGGNTISFTTPGTPGAKSVNWTSMAAGQNYWYTFYSTNEAGSECSAKQTFTASAALADPTPKTKEIGPQAVNGAFSITTTRNTNAAVSGTGATVASGNNTTSKSINMAAFTEGVGKSRVSTVTLTTVGELPLRSNTATVTQHGVVYPASFTAVSNVPKEGKAATAVDVLSNIPWQAASNQSWCTIGNATQTGANDKTGSTKSFTYTVAANTGAPREAIITVKGTGAFATAYSRTFKVSQLTGTWLNIDQANQATGPQAKSHTLGITSNTSWTLASNNANVATVASASGTNNQSVAISVKDNATTGSRTAIITATPTGNSAKSYTITQYGVVFPASFAVVTDVPASGKTATNVPVTSNIPWQATSNQSWCTIDGNTVTGTVHTGSNTKDGSAVNFTYTVSANTGVARIATITVKGTGSFTGITKTFTVTQKAGYQGNLKPIDPGSNDQTNEFN